MKATPRLKRFFSPLIIAYCVAVSAVVLMILYIAFNKTVITITLEPTATSFDFAVAPETMAAESVELTFEHSFTFTNYPATSADGTATGTVTIVNNYSANQPLVATTRLLSTEGVLFRTAETVTVPAGGEVEVEVYADQAGSSGNIGPSKFEIVALWQGLKDKIYATSATAMTGGVIKRVTMTNELAEQAKNEATAAAKVYAQELLTTDVSNRNIDEAEMGAVLYDDFSQVISPAIGETGDSVVVTSTGRIATVVYQPDNLLSAIEESSNNNVYIDDITSAVTRTADGNLVVSGSATLAGNLPTTDSIDRSALTNQTTAAIIEKLSAVEGVKEVTVKLSPVWAKRTPALEQQIKLIIVPAK